MGEIISFFGGDNQVGTTMVSQSLAQRLKQTGKKVLYIQCSGKCAEGFFSPSLTKGLDDIKADILTGQINIEEINHVIEKRKGLSIIGSVKNSYSAKYFPDNTMEIVLKEICNEYDYIVLDAGSSIDLGLGISALSIADKRYYVLTQQRKTIERFSFTQMNFLNPLKFNGKLVINKFLKEPSFFTKKEIETICKEDVSACIPYMEYGWQAEVEGNILMRFPKFERHIEKIEADILERGRETKYVKGIFHRRISE